MILSIRVSSKADAGRASAHSTSAGALYGDGIRKLWVIKDMSLKESCSLNIVAFFKRLSFNDPIVSSWYQFP